MASIIIPRIDHDFLAAHSEGLICTSGCMSAEAPRAVREARRRSGPQEARLVLRRLWPGQLFLRTAAPRHPELEDLNRNLIDLGKRYNARFVATNDVHYINPEDARYQDILLAIQTGALLSDPNRMHMTDESYYLRSPAGNERAVCGCA